MSDIPDAMDVKASWVWEKWDGETAAHYDALAAAFDRWLAGERARIWDEAYSRGQLESRGLLPADRRSPNPYRGEAQ